AGKTRLAIETARNLPTAYDTICFVELAEVTEPELVIDVILQALAIKKTHTASQELLVEALGQRPTLLILDNFEQIAETGASVVWELLECLPSLVCLVTTRQRLDLSGEQEFPLSPLPVPSLPGTPERLMEFPSVQLYLDRVRAVRPDFRLTSENAATVSALCAKLEGIPLATELAAAWAAVLSPAQTLERLESRFDLLAGRHRDLPTRHRTLRAAIEWSYRLLSPELQFFFARLSVFHGGWTLEAAQEVCEEPDALAYLGQLRDRSLVLSEEVEAAMRYRMLESLREFAAEALPVQEREEIRQRHLEYYVGFAEQAETHQHGAGERQWLKRLELEHDNMRSALDFARIASEGSVWGLRLCAALSLFWRVRGHFAEGRRWYAAALNRKGAEERTHARASALSGAAILALVQDDLEEAEQLLTETAAIEREQGDRKGMAGTLNNLGLIAMEQGDNAKAQPLFEESLALSREIGNRYVEATNLHNLAILATSQGDARKERALFEACLALRRELNDLRGVAMALANLAQSLCTHQDLPAAQQALLEGLELCREMGDMHYSTFFVEVSALLLYHRKLAERAARLLGAAQAAREALGTPIPRTGNEYHASVLASLREQLGEAVFHDAWASGQLLSLDQALVSALEELAQLS
ncbi:MAG TPA: tetratricopeptide repeat protein, partial [Chthonomonadaceae bacterium]|nr:tetratricopeptide repeat protein [Chthonomonadaceae bacterium]